MLLRGFSSCYNDCCCEFTWWGDWWSNNASAVLRSALENDDLEPFRCIWMIIKCSYVVSHPVVEYFSAIGTSPLSVKGARCVWAGRDFYRAIPAMTRDLGLQGLFLRTAPFRWFLVDFYNMLGIQRAYSNPDSHGITVRRLLLLRVVFCLMKNW